MRRIILLAASMLIAQAAFAQSSAAKTASKAPEVRPAVTTAAPASGSVAPKAADVKPAIQPPPEDPQLGPVELTALRDVANGLTQAQNALQQNQQLFQQISMEITQRYPGFHLNPKNPFSGELIKNPEPAPVAPASATTPASDQPKK